MRRSVDGLYQVTPTRAAPSEVVQDEALHPAQIAAYRRMTPRQKLDQALALYWSARALKADCCGS